jgi:hypothetical protein
MKKKQGNKKMSVLTTTCLSPPGVVTKESSIMLLEESIAVDDAAKKAIQLINELSNKDVANSKSNPDEMYHLLDVARNDIMVAWNRLQQVTTKSQQEQKEEDVDQEEENDDVVKTCAIRKQTTTNTKTTPAIDLRPAFIDMITDAFGDVLDNLRQSEEVDVTILVDCLQSGLEIISNDVANDDDDFLWNDDLDFSNSSNINNNNNNVKDNEG